MMKLRSCKNLKGEIRYEFTCPGCGEDHAFNNTWQVTNADKDNVTVKPSLLCRGYIGEKVSTICHSFITNGKIQFLADCTHANKNKTMELKDV